MHEEIIIASSQHEGGWPLVGKQNDLVSKTIYCEVDRLAATALELFTDWATRR